MSFAPSFIVVFLVFAACSSDPATLAPVADMGPTSTETIAADTLDLPPVNSAALEEYLDTDGVTAALAYDRAFRSADSGEDLKAAYEQALDLVPYRDGMDMEKVITFNQAELGLAGLLPSCVAECSEASFDLDIPTWQRAAQLIGDESAVTYFDLLERLYDFPEREEDPDTWADFPIAVGLYDGDLVGSPIYRTQTWDYGGYSNLGSGLHAELLTAFVSASSQGAFEDDISSLREGIALDLLEATCIGPSAEAAQSEVVQVNDSMTAPDIAQTSYDARIAAFDDLEDSGLQAECAELDASCSCTGG